MVVEDGVVKSVHVEAPGEFKVSSAEFVLAQL
jgi:peroxiredoxin